MKLRLITGVLLVWLFAGCGQGTDSRIGESGPIDRHVSHLILTKHARCRMDCRHITEAEIREVLEKGEINYKKSEPDAHPDPKYALEGYTKEGQHLRIILAVPTGRRGAESSLVVVTCIELGVEWQCDCH